MVSAEWISGGPGRGEGATWTGAENPPLESRSRKYRWPELYVDGGGGAGSQEGPSSGQKGE